jgi:hypothetical protein
MPISSEKNPNNQLRGLNAKSFSYEWITPRRLYHSHASLQNKGCSRLAVQAWSILAGQIRQPAKNGLKTSNR